MDQCFLPIDAQRIKSMPLNSLPQPNILFWPSSSTGDYSVKTGNKLLCEEEQRDKPSASNPDPMKKIWASIWKLQVPGKVKHFMWGACTNFLPV